MEWLGIEGKRPKQAKGIQNRLEMSHGSNVATETVTGSTWNLKEALEMVRERLGMSQKRPKWDLECHTEQEFTRNASRGTDDFT